MAPSVDDIMETIDVANDYVEENMPQMRPTVDLSSMKEYFLTPESDFIPPSHLSITFSEIGKDLPEPGTDRILLPKRQSLVHDALIILLKDLNSHPKPYTPVYFQEDKIDPQIELKCLLDRYNLWKCSSIFFTFAPSELDARSELITQADFFTRVYKQTGKILVILNPAQIYPRLQRMMILAHPSTKVSNILSSYLDHALNLETPDVFVLWNSAFIKPFDRLSSFPLNESRLEFEYCSRFEAKERLSYQTRRIVRLRSVFPSDKIMEKITSFLFGLTPAFPPLISHAGTIFEFENSDHSESTKLKKSSIRFKRNTGNVPALSFSV